MSIILLIFSFFTAIISLLLSTYIFYSDEKINEDREKLLKSVKEYKGPFNYNKATAIIQIIISTFMILYFLIASSYMSYYFIPYLVGLLVVLSIQRFFYVKNYLFGDKTTKSWSTAILYILTLIFSILYILAFWS